MASTAPPSPALPTVGQSSFTFRTDVERLRYDAHRCGILHAMRTRRGREEHAFAWLDDKAVAHRAVAHLGAYGFQSCKFIPYGRREDWMHRYPHACPYIECNSIGQIKGVPYFQQCVNDNGEEGAEAPPRAVEDASSSSRPAKRQKSRGAAASEKEAPKMIPSGSLTDAERSLLHNEIYDYFSWLHAELSELETNSLGRGKVRRAGISVWGVQNLLTKLETTFREVEEYKKRKDERGNEGNGNDDGSKKEDGEGTMTAPPNEDSEKENDDPKTPLLEERLKPDLHSVVEKMQQQEQARKRQERQEKRQSAQTKIQDFEDFFRRILAYKEANGHTDVMVSYKDEDGVALGRWVGDLRKNKRLLRAKGRECEPIDSADPARWEGGRTNVHVAKGRLGLTLQMVENNVGLRGAIVTRIDPACAFQDRIKLGDRLVEIDGEEVNTAEDLARGKDKEVRIFSFRRSSAKGLKSLTMDRVQRLDDIGFNWESEQVKNQMPWDQRFDHLKQYKETRGHWPKRKEKWHNLGVWVHNQRKAYTQKDKKFMAERAPKLDAIGFPWSLKKVGTILSWEDYIQKLAEFHRVNRHFDVPRPDSDDDDDEAVRFHRWVKGLHTSYRANQRGKPSQQPKLNEERVQQLLDMGFVFDEEGGYSNGGWRNVPDIPFERRLEQMQRWHDEMGHLNIDHRQDSWDNFGGWAARVSRRYRDWQEGQVTISHLEEHQFNQLRSLGFEFNVLPPEVRTCRSWEDNFQAFLRFVREEGHALVPQKYKADRRLGTWTTYTRTQYKLWQAGKKSTMTQERVERLENAGFQFEIEGRWAAKKAREEAKRAREEH